MDGVYIISIATRRLEIFRHLLLHRLNFLIRTKVVEKSLSPTWEETFEFPVKDFSRRLDLTVLDWDVVAAEKIGGFGIKLEDLVHKKRVNTYARSTVSLVSNRFDLIGGRVIQRQCWLCL